MKIMVLLVGQKSFGKCQKCKKQLAHWLLEFIRLCDTCAYEEAAK